MRYFLIAGEASGDMHGANLMKALRRNDASAEFVFLGGDLMKQVGGVQIKDYREMAFMGIVNVLMNMNKVLKNFRDCEQALSTHKPDVVILIDYPSFNLRIAKWVKKHLPQTPVYYYIAPKLWAWKSWRIKSIKKYVDKMFTIFPFETAYFAGKGYAVDYVGNPTVDAIDNYLQQATPNIPSKPTIALLAGSRKQEIKGCLKTMVAAAKMFPDYQIVVTTAPSIDEAYYREILGEDTDIQLSHNTYETVRTATVAVVNSGTATLETALLRTPQIVVYHVFGGRFASLLRKILIKIPYVSLVNLIGEKEVAKELIAHQFTKENIVRELHTLLYNNAIQQQMLSDYDVIAAKLGEPDTAERASKAIINSLHQTKKRVDKTATF
ncbi:MAG: lipid-A-disaccharide synthase [Bacteroidales bacterium]|nr:lipid-A-disaccharide synthase [Bacteroidales bacterium]